MARISRFTPWQTPREQLEKIFVAHQPILDDLLERALQIAEAESRVHTLIVGPHGAGKTHLLALLYYRLHDAIDSGTRIQIARLPEDPITITSYPRLLAALVTSIKADQKAGLDADNLEFTLDQMAQADGPIVVLIENLDEVFNQIGTDGQRKFRHYLQTSNSLLLISTTPVLGRSINDQASPFYCFFSVVSLPPLKDEQAQQMLINIARLQGNKELAHYLEGKQAVKRLKIISALAGSYPRIWSIFSEVMTPDSLQHIAIAELLYASFDDLAPYYRDRLMSLTPQQRLVISELAEANHPLHVQEIAERAQLPERSTARTAGELKEAHWIEPVETSWTHLLDGRRVYYELSEPLTRLAFQAKDVIDQPVKLVVSFLSAWFDPDAALRHTQRLAGIAGSQANDATLLGEADDALSGILSGNAELFMTLPSPVRIVLEQRCQEASQGAKYNLIALRRKLHRDAMGYLGMGVHEPQLSQWIARSENLAAITGEAEDLSIWSEWLACAGRLDQAETVLRLIDDGR
ncbi:MAG: hypothetical protein FWD65_07800 [Coriobacteriia bacterium]|nr:hypothetical protein [Coriobacteriia bacterium]